MKIIEIAELDHPGIAPYRSLAKGAINHGRADELIIVESPKVIERALDAGLKPLSLLCERGHIEGDARGIIERIGDADIFTGSRKVLAGLTGYTLTRGVLCAMKRPEPPSADSIMADARRICVIYDVCDATNIGVIFRTAAALGYDALMLSPGSCDPLNRRSIRVSMGNVFLIPWCFEPDIQTTLRKHNFRSVGMALKANSIFLQDFSVKNDEKYAVFLGSEGYGLPDEVIDRSDYVVKIPMHHNVDSLNVGAAAAIALWHFRP